MEQQNIWNGLTFQKQALFAESRKGASKEVTFLETVRTIVFWRGKLKIVQFLNANLSPAWTPFS